ncbi:MAG TPA: GNAT family N-acetyltransferase [Abditibacteriaceae bacterium]|nr:GNAT family N-acetyltransferase [Abditibacteriaceae bacterium]
MSAGKARRETRLKASRQQDKPSAPALYQRKRGSMRQALELIRRGGRIFLGSGCAEPQTLSDGLIEYAHFFADNIIIHILTQGEAAYTRPEYSAHFRHNAFFIGANVRQAVQEGRADYTPIFLSEIPALFASGQMPLDAALIQVAPPDAQGFCSLGISVDVVKSAAQNARVVIAEVNRQMPRTFGDSFIHLNDIDAVVESDASVQELRVPAPDEITDRIGYYVSRLVKDGATLQMGIGAIPNAALAHLKDKNDLGVHTEMFSDGIMDLVQRGNITGTRKTLHPNAIVTSFCMGTRVLYDWVHENPHALFFPSDYTNDPGIIRQNDNMAAINSAIAVDLTGQVCADSIGSRFYSGIGGQVDFMRGAAKSRGGRPIIALPSTAKNGTVSRIVPVLEAGSGVVTSRGDVHYVVTEYGVAYLYGKSVTERALSLIEIAHPDFRNDLLEAAKARRYTYGDLGRFPLQQDDYPSQYEHAEKYHHTQHGEIEIFFRPIRATDERRLQDFFYSHTEETVYLRYGMMVRAMPHQRALELVQLDYQRQLALVGLIGEPGNERIIAIGRYILDEQTNLVEVAFVVHEEYRGLGLASHLLQSLVQIARDKNFAGVTAQVLAENTGMLHVFNEVLGPADETRSESGETSLCYWFSPRQIT